jgi:hypothetical protein
MWQAIGGIVAEIKKCEKANATIAAIALTYILIDTLAFLAMPEAQPSQTKNDFIAWANKYVKGATEQPYQYDGRDVYAARCSLLHAFSAEADLHRKNPDIKKFGYHAGDIHAFDKNISQNLVIIGTASLINDVLFGVGSFLEDCKRDPALKARVECRLPALHQNFPYPS